MTSCRPQIRKWNKKLDFNLDVRELLKVENTFVVSQSCY